MRPDNTISWVTDGALDTFIRDEAALEVKGRLTAAGLPVLADASARGEDARTSALIGMMTLATAYPDGGMTRGYLAFLSHWKEFLHWLPAGADIESSWAAAYDEQKDFLDALLRDVATPDDRPGAEAQQWRGWAQEAHDPARDLARRGLVLPYPHADRFDLAKGMGDDLGRRWGGDDDRSYSDFHVQFRKLDFTRLGDSDAFSAYRFTINCFFDLVTLMDVSPLERYALAYFLTRAVEDQTETTWSDIVARGVARQALDPDAHPTLPWRGR
ncbi:hypothetical protein [Clavibacter michiganensis]|uniref:hypothetical protein n=1 Tax=Clavibacter michiganensis TaxID=28447 RepID=UPI0011C23CDB